MAKNQSVKNLAHLFRKINGLARRDIKNSLRDVQVAMYVFDILQIDYLKWKCMNDRKDLYANDLSWMNLTINKRIDEICLDCYAHVPTLGIMCDVCMKAFPYERTFYVDDDDFVLEIIDVLKLNERVSSYFHDEDIREAANIARKYCPKCVQECNIGEFCVDCPRKDLTNMKIFTFDALRLPLLAFPLFFDAANVFNVEYSIVKYIYGKSIVNKYETVHLPKFDVGVVKNDTCKLMIKNKYYINFTRLDASRDIRSYKTLQKQQFVNVSFCDEVKRTLSGDSFTVNLILMINGFRWCRQCDSHIPDKGFTNNCETCIDLRRRLESYYDDDDNFVLEALNENIHFPDINERVSKLAYKYLTIYNNFDTCVYEYNCHYCKYKCFKCATCERRMRPCVKCRKNERDLKNKETFQVFNCIHRLMMKAYKRKNIVDSFYVMV